ncbi:hypothetical protein ACFXB3_11270 [Streptomyces sp. NPDC059447]|uniref:hypothetical protein n=1 Tax=Streptomyces sp. NPDC059447 TaxID=3346834 RepID=UPI003684366E
MSGGAGLDVNQERSVGAALAEGELVDAQDPRGPFRPGRRVQEFQEPRATYDEMHSAAQPFAGPAAELDRDLPQPALQPEARAAIPLAQLAELLDEGPSAACLPVAEEPPDRKSYRQFFPASGRSARLRT